MTLFLPELLKSALNRGVTQTGVLSGAGQRRVLPLKHLKETWLLPLESFPIQSHLINLDPILWYL